MHPALAETSAKHSTRAKNLHGAKGGNFCLRTPALRGDTLSKTLDSDGSLEPHYYSVGHHVWKACANVPVLSTLITSGTVAPARRGRRRGLRRRIFYYFICITRHTASTACYIIFPCENPGMQTILLLCCACVCCVLCVMCVYVCVLCVCCLCVVLCVCVVCVCVCC